MYVAAGVQMARVDDHLAARLIRLDRRYLHPQVAREGTGYPIREDLGGDRRVAPAGSPWRA